MHHSRVSFYPAKSKRFFLLDFIPAIWHTISILAEPDLFFLKQRTFATSLRDVHQTKKQRHLYLMQSFECRTIAVAGPCSTGKSELSRQMGTMMNRTEIIDPLVIHIGDMHRFFHDFGVKIGDGPEAIERSAQLALEQVRLVVDQTTGEMNLKPKNGDRFRQSHENGVGASSLGNNGDLALFAEDFIRDAVEKLEKTDTMVLIIDGREQMLRWFTKEAALQAVLVRTHAELPVRTALYRQERPEAREYADEQIHTILAQRDEKDRSILAPTLAQTRYVIDVERSTSSMKATVDVAAHVTGVVFRHFYGHSPDRFDIQPVSIKDKE